MERILQSLINKIDKEYIDVPNTCPSGTKIKATPKKSVYKSSIPKSDAGRAFREYATVCKASTESLNRGPELEPSPRMHSALKAGDTISLHLPESALYRLGYICVISNLSFILHLHFFKCPAKHL